jgi:hypothetical protein
MTRGLFPSVRGDGPAGARSTAIGATFARSTALASERNVDSVMDCGQNESRGW